MAGAGTGKTHTLVERCLDLICNEQISLDEMLIVTFTEAAAAEVRERLRNGLEEAISQRPNASHLPEQLALFDAAHIGTLHSFCFKLIRGHFHALGLDPQLSVLDEAQARLLADEILEEQFQAHYQYIEDEDEDDFSLAVQDLITVYGNGRDDGIRALVLRLHHYIQTRSDAESWLAQQIEGFSSTEPTQWREWYLNAVQEWRDEWLPILKSLQAENIKAGECLEILEKLPADAATSARSWGPLFRKIAAVDRPEDYPYRKKTILRKPLEGFFDDAEFLGSLVVVPPPSAKHDVPNEGDVEGNNDNNSPSPTPSPRPDPLPAAAPPPPQVAERPQKPAAVGKSKGGKSLSLFIQEELDFSFPVPPVPPVAQAGKSVTMPQPAIPVAPVQTGPQLIEDDSPEPLLEDWEWSRDYMKTLLLLAKEFSEKFSTRKRADGVVDFHDLEQFAIKLVCPFEDERDTKGVAAITAQWRNKLRFIFVDEYQDINAAQDKIISALGRDNRFLVGDVKQSIYRFRLTDPAIFRDYAKNPESWKARVIALRENFRSREGLLDFVNSVFESLMREDIGGVLYDDQAKLRFGAPDARGELSVKQNPGPRVEMLLREKKRSSAAADAGGGDDALGDLQEAELEALTVATRLREMKESGHLIWDNSSVAPAQAGRAAKWSDFAVLLRSPGSKREIYAKQFASAGVPLHVERGGFYDTREILDLLSLLQLADNPLQDVPCIAVLRSPLVSCSLDELAEIRLAGHGHFWFAVNRAAEPGSGVNEATRLKIGKFLDRFSRWRKLARQASLSECLEEILTETHYDDWLVSRPRGEERRANVRRFLHLAEQFDTFQRQGLFRFLRFVNAQREIEAEPEVAPLAGEDAVRLMSIHQSKGLEFPVVVLADLGKTFNEQDLRGEIILDEQYGLCPRVKPPSAGGRYPSLAYWLARKHQRRELRGEEMRLLYVALTRAQDSLILSGGVSPKKWDGYFAENASFGPRDIVLANSCMDWLGMWLAIRGIGVTVEAGAQGESPLIRWKVVDDSELVKEPAQGPAPTLGRPADLSVSASLRRDRAEAQGEGREIGDTAGLETCATSPWDEATLNRLNEVLKKYPFEPATERAAKTSVTALRREAADADDEAEQQFRQPLRPARAGSSRQRSVTKLNAADTGVAHHKFLQYFSFETVIDLRSFAAEAKRLEEENYLSPEEAEALDLEALADFWSSDVGKAIRANAAHVRRELAFTAGFKPRELDEMFGREPNMSLDDETIVVQGVADLVVLLPKEIWLVDFKTDDVRVKDLPEKVEFYSPQLKLYAQALKKIYSRPITSCRLHFLAARKTVGVEVCQWRCHRDSD
jgi:ATP-dependent helicase/nuclease subunit A